MEFLLLRFKIRGVKCVCYRGLWLGKVEAPLLFCWQPQFSLARALSGRSRCVKEAVKYYGAVDDSLKNKLDFTCEMS